MLRHLTPHLSKSAEAAPVSVASFRQVQESHVFNQNRKTIKLLSHNIQVGIQSAAYRHYLTRGWQHLLPHPRRTKNLDAIAAQLARFDFVALQEADGGSRRSGYTNQVQYLACSAGFPYWYQQLNRNLGKWGQHSNGVLSKLRPQRIEDYKLPGLIPGRGAIVAHFGTADNPLVLVVLHLSLGARARQNQLSYVKEIISDFKHVIIMGDLNSGADHILNLSPLSEIKLKSATGTFNTYPSWRPTHHLDHILVSPSLNIKHAEVLPCCTSDHLPIAMEVELPLHFNAFH